MCQINFLSWEHTDFKCVSSNKNGNRAWDFLYNKKTNYANINSEIILEKLRSKVIDFQKCYS